jgi:O-succinylbenzoic acid--CoA ligase
MVPLQVEKLLDEDPNRLNKTQKIIIGGAPISQRLERRIQQLSSLLFATYGMTETASHVALRQLNGTDRSQFFRLLPGIKANQDQRGCLVLQSDFFSSEIVTNDIVEFEDFDAFKWLGRYDNIINSGGVKIVPEQVEGKIEDLFDRRFYISSQPDAQLGQRVVLHIEGAPLDSATKSLLQNELVEILDKFEIPKELVFHAKFEETRTGKVNRKQS